MLPCSAPDWRSSRTRSSNWRIICMVRYSPLNTVGSRGISALVGRSVGAVAMLFSFNTGGHPQTPDKIKGAIGGHPPVPRQGSAPAPPGRRSRHEAPAVDVEDGADA